MTGPPWLAWLLPAVPLGAGAVLAIAPLAARAVQAAASQRVNAARQGVSAAGRLIVRS